VAILTGNKRSNDSRTFSARPVGNLVGPLLWRGSGAQHRWV